MNITKFIVLPVLAALTATFTAAAASPADELLDKVVEWTSAKKTIEVDYTIGAADSKAEGTIAIDGERFRVMSDIVDAWYDGTTQWAYSPETGEVNITEPTDEELQQINPFVIINAFRRNYTVALKPAEADEKHQVVLFTPKDLSADITRVELSVPKGYYYPARIVVWTASGETIVIYTKRFIRGKRFADADFQYASSIHPEAEIVDLR